MGRKKLPRKISISLSQDLQRILIPCGVYKLEVGDKFYIGRSFDIKRRVDQYEREITGLLTKYPRHKKLPMIHYLSNVFEQLKLNPDLRQLKISLLEICDKDDIVICEQKWLDWGVIRPGFLNIGSEAKPCKNDFIYNNPIVMPLS